MTYPRQEFLNFQPDETDRWSAVEPVLRFDDLAPRDDSLPITLSVMIAANDYRKAQILRTLECLARQKFRDIEVLVAQIGGNQDLGEACARFLPYLRVRFFKLEREGFAADPSRGFRAMIPEAQGDYIAAMQAEIMLTEEACGVLVRSMRDPMLGSTFHSCLDASPLEDWLSKEKFIVLRIGFLDGQCQQALDQTDWHSHVREIEQIYSYNRHGEGLSNRGNTFWRPAIHFPWWFVGCAKREAGIWKDMPEMLGHAMIDFYLMNYRISYGYVDILPPGLYGYHQYHFRTAVGMKDEEPTMRLALQERARRERGGEQVE